jgi:ferredoxin-NADP reductase
MFAQMLTGPSSPSPSLSTPPVTPRPGPGRGPAARRLVRRLGGSGLFEALAAPHGVDRYLELLRPGLSLHDPRAEIVDVAHRTPASVTLRLRPNGAWRGFRAGQFVAVTVEIDGVRRTRCYSPASSQHAVDGELELTIRAHPEGLLSRHLHRHARPGAVVDLAQAQGDFVLPMRQPERLLLISGGSGITPVMSMLRTLCDERRDTPLTFLHYARRAQDVPYLAELDQLASRHPNVRIATACTRESRRGLRGHLTRAQLRAVEPAYRQAEVYVCGPPGLIAATRALWARDGQPERVHSESFLPPRLPAAAGASGRVRFARSGIELAGSALTLLEQAERADLSPAHGCRMGICHTCTCRKLTGRVRNITSGELSSSEEEEIQICVSVPDGDVELDL